MTHQKLTMAPRQAVTKANAQCKRADKAGEGLILDEWCATTDWPRNDARKALTGALTPRLVRPWAPRRPIHSAEIIAALACGWAVLGAPTGKRPASIMAELVPRPRRFQELVITDDAELALLEMSAATMDRWLAPTGPSCSSGAGSTPSAGKC